MGHPSVQKVQRYGPHMNSVETPPPAPTRATCSHFYKYSAFTSGDRQTWLKEIMLEHRIYVPNFCELNDPLDGRTWLIPMSPDKMISVLSGDVLARNPHMSVKDQHLHDRILGQNI